MKADLHMHSSQSDGVLSPDQLAEAAERAGVELMALTDHDTFEGSDMLLRSRSLPISVIPGVELSMKNMHSLHLLAYGIASGAPLRMCVRRQAQRRRERADKMLDRLAELGMPIDREELKRQCQGTVGRPHIARAMVRLGYVKSLQEAFSKYLDHGRPAYIASERMTIEEAIPLVLDSGFVPVLAHPRELGLEDHLLLPLLEQWKAMGLMGMEVYHPSAMSKGFEGLERMARRLGLIVTGGSDFHQENDKHGRLGCTMAYWSSSAEDVDALMEAMRRGEMVDKEMTEKNNAEEKHREGA